MTDRKPVFAASVTVLAARRLDADNVVLTLAAPETAALAQPGQFVELRADRFLNRPLGVAAADPVAGTIAVGVKQVGAGSAWLAGLQEGNTVQLYGPFGRGFAFDGVDRAYVVGGGTGIYPLWLLLDTLRQHGIETYAACGFRTAAQAILGDEFRAAATHYVTACEKGGGDLTGTAVDALDLLAGQHGLTDKTRVYACGPIPMLMAVNAWCERHGVAAECSFEARMGCGFGVCRGCAVPVLKDGRRDYDRCCVEGPVFARDEIDWEALA